jgi:hypothetical protein
VESSPVRQIDINSITGILLDDWIDVLPGTFEAHKPHFVTTRGPSPYGMENLDSWFSFEEKGVSGRLTFGPLSSIRAIRVGKVLGASGTVKSWFDGSYPG